MAQLPPSKTHPASPYNPSSTSSLEKPELSSASSNPSIGPFHPYNSPLLPASPLLKKIVGDAISMSGGPAAVLLQVAHPKVGAGVTENSSFTTRPVARGRRSIVYIFAQIFGTEEERRYITDMTHRSHAKIVKASNLETGEVGYNANDPELQLWVAATTYWSPFESYQVAYGEFDTQTAEYLHKEFSVMATAFHVPPEMWPKDRAAFKVYWDEQISKLSVDGEVRKVAHEVLYPSGLPFWYWVYFEFMGPVSRIVTREMLPRRVAKMYGMGSTRWSRLVYGVLRELVRMGYSWQPMWAKTVLKDFYEGYEAED